MSVMLQVEGKKLILQTHELMLFLKKICGIILSVGAVLNKQLCNTMALLLKEDGKNCSLVQQAEDYWSFKKLFSLESSGQAYKLYVFKKEDTECMHCLAMTLLWCR